MKKILSILSITLITLLGTVSYSHAEGFDTLSLSASPESPAQGQSVRIVAESYSLSLDQAKITWYTNGKKMLEGVGKKELVTKMPTTGNLSVRFVVTNKDNTTTEQTLTVQGASLDLIYEAIDSYAPPFYKGKVRIPEESVVKVVAMRNVEKALPEDTGVTYQWSRNDSNIPAVSGYGKNVYYVKLDPFYNSERIAVTATNQDLVSSQQSLDLTPTQSQVVLYEVNPLYGINYDQALSGSVTARKGEITIDAEPFFFSPTNKLSDVLQYTWLLNGVLIDSKSNNSQLNLQNTGGDKKTATLELTVGHTVRTLEQAFNRLQLEF